MPINKVHLSIANQVCPINMINRQFLDKKKKKKKKKTLKPPHTFTSLCRQVPNTCNT